MEEFEIKFLEVNVPELEKKLLTIGAKKVGEYDYSRMLLDYPDFRLNQRGSWLRLRTNGIETTLAFKERIKDPNDSAGLKDLGMKEVEVVVDDYKQTYELFKALGFVIKREEKNKRIRYLKKDVVFDIDFWPQIPPYLEIESNSFKEAEDAAVELGFDPKDSVICSAGKVYKKYGFNTDEYSSITPEGMIKK
ncbi:CYTH domain-containing protein [Candidatus Nomurabacteria bacterium]|nr:CYTH domain-containing protein [Candidatus Nomurabacteria bacterium]